jgi:hypothetical protein
MVPDILPADAKLGLFKEHSPTSALGTELQRFIQS